MSIIYEALKKVEGKASAEPQSQPFQTVVGAGPARPVKKRPVKIGKKPHKRRDTSLGLAVICLVFVVSFFLYNYLSKPPEYSEPAILSAAPLFDKVPPQVVSQPSPAAKAFDSKEYVLEGIVYDAGAPFAIINGKVVKTYDTIGAFIIKQIDQQEVEMVNVDGSRKLTLSLY